MSRLLIIGGSDAGISAALRIKELDRQADVTVMLADAYPGYSICGLSFFLSGKWPTGMISPPQSRRIRRSRNPFIAQS